MAYTTVDDGSAYFQTKLYTGTGSSNSVTNGGNSDLQPDWVWIKERDGTGQHGSFDSSRGVQKELKIDEAGTESTAAQSVTAFNSDGFTVGTAGDYNGSSNEQIAWQWKANGGSTTTNDASSTGVGDQDSVYQVNTTAGFSIVTYTGTGSDNEDYAHGLGASPELIIIKARDASTGWSVNHISKGMTSGYLQLQADSAFASASNNVKAVSSTTFRLGVDSWVNGNGVDFVGYFFKSIQGYSKFGSYVGNANADGPFIYTGFKPAWVMTKNTSNAGGWAIMDTGRSPFNVMNEYLIANTTDAESSGQDFDIDSVSNGFKVRYTNGNYNANGDTIIYIAFAEHPFVSSKGVPVTAK